MKNQVEYTEEVLFDNYMVSSLGEEFVHSQIPFYFDNLTYKKMAFYSEEINRISLEILEGIKDKHKDVLKYFDDFKYKDRIFNLSCPIAPMFWTRYDTFRDVDNNIYFAEFNYDKPCGQKEIHLAGKSDFKGNLNKDFIDNLIGELLKICNNYNTDDNIINVGFLMDPCHYEELHHSYYFKHILKGTNINIVQVGPKNLSVKDGYVYAYSQIKLPIILRLFPTEFFNEISNIDEILNTFDNGNVLLINDPRVIAIQSKGFFAYLWDLVKINSKLISNKDKEIIKQCIPYTEIFKINDFEDAIKNKDNYVIKSSLGRYSQEVYIGELYKEKSWLDKINGVIDSGKIHIKQNLINIKQEYTYSPDYDNMNIPILAYGNFGVYIIDHNVKGFLVRWSSDFLTDDNYTWMCPLGVDDFPIHIEKNLCTNRKKTWDSILEKITFNYDFTGEYTNVDEYISLDSLILNKNFYDEIIFASNKFCKILKRIYPYIQKNMELFGPILGIPEELYKLVSTSLTSSLCALGRIDFGVDNNGNLKILEINSETPAGLVEAIGANHIIKKELDIKYMNPNRNFREGIKKSFKFILEEIEKFKKIKNIAVVTSWYYEDIYTSKIIAKILKELKDYNVILGNVYDLRTNDDKIFLYGNEIHAIYRHYPLDWFYYEEDMRKLISPLNSGDYLINPGHTLITQSKSLITVIYELVGKGFFSDEDENFIKKYIPYTSLEIDSKLSSDFIIKPYLSREGSGISMAYETRDYSLDEVIYQDRVNIRPFSIEVYSTIGKNEKYKFPIIGVYVTDENPAGIYTRVGDIVTNKNSNYISTYIK